MKPIGSWVKPGLILLLMGLAAWFSPTSPLDPWNLINPKKISTMVFALSFIQIFGSAMNQLIGFRAGAILTGFFGGLVSSTATTASLARKSQLKKKSDYTNELLIFLSATAAMLFEGLALFWTGTSDLHLSGLILFLGPLLATGILIFFFSRNRHEAAEEPEEIAFKIIPVLKLTCFIISILALSKILQTILGQKGLMILTFLVSLFEIHGSVIANVQLHESGTISISLLINLLAISIAASYLSKLFLISTLGRKALQKLALKSTAFLLISLLISWLICVLLLSSHFTTS